MEELSDKIEKNTGMKIIIWKGYRTFYGGMNGTSNTFIIVEGEKKGAFKNFDINGKQYHLIIV